MPELPDVTVYVERIAERVLGEPLLQVRIPSAFVLRTAVPPIAEAVGRRITAVRRLGKRIVLALDEERYLVLHLMIAGRLRWLAPGAKLPGRLGLLGLDFPPGTLALTEAGKQRRASLHFVTDLAEFERGGLEVLGSSAAEFTAAMTRERHTLKRALTDPGILSGIGNAYSDEILHRARLSPLRLSDQLGPDEWARLHQAAQAVLTEWTIRLRAESAGKFPEHVTAFRDGMAAHGRYGQACPACGGKIQRIVHAKNETNYCPTCQTGGRLLADLALSRLLRDDWPRSIEELEERKAGARR
jgi:formamidopyrimidine-DNA glycosylase